MRDSRLEQLAYNLVNYSVRVQPGENVLINAKGKTPELVAA
ncbi:aminopeptidase, partial [Mesorhizobium sp. M00.F.Ca.ET.186.01.1.1]